MSASQTLTPDEQEALRRWIQQRGERAVSEELALHRQTVLAAAVGQPVRRSTLRLLRLGLAEVRPC